MDILTRIVEHTRGVIAEHAAAESLSALKDRVAEASRPGNSLRARLAEQKPHVIAEFKRKSPSKPVINLEANPVDVATQYAEGGASAMSVLTEPGFFGGSLDDLRAIRGAVNLPLLRKDFMVDPYQFYQAKAAGADLVLLIARILEADQVAEFTALAHELDMEVLLEIHHPDELAKAGRTPIDLLGVNCRDLKAFQTNLDHLVTMSTELPEGVPWVAESGIAGPADVRKLYNAGYQLFLVGEYLMRGESPADRLHGLVAG